ncbi:MAG: hypothetical protein EXQ53_10030 [Acidobacteria bacterium]|nr:hypothetical protein [Acidobacteriota bacterium]
MTRLLALILGVLASGAAAWGQSARVTMNEEPHHQRLTYIRHMRVFEATLSPGEATLDHAHDHDVATLALGDMMSRLRRVGEDWSAPRMRALGSAEATTYTGVPAVHRAENVGAAPYRMLVVENLRDGGWSTPPPLGAPGTVLRQEARAFAVYDVRLSAATPRTNHVHQNPTLVVLMSGTVEVQGGGGESEFRLGQTGRWFPSSGADQPHTLAVVGPGEAHVVCVEAR